MNRETHFSSFVLNKLQPFVENFPIQYIDSKRNCQLAYRHFRQDLVADKLVVLVNGRAENLLKWTELAYDFYQQGYDVLVFEHRGQGYSQRLLKDREKGYIDEFRFYAEDMDKLISTVTTQFSYQHQYLLAHSMGALVSSYYLTNHNHQIKRAVFSAPFFAVPTNNPMRDELLVNLMMLLGQGSRYVFGKSAYQPANLLSNKLSSCKVRMKWMNRINKLNPELRLGGPTFRWLHLCWKAIQGLAKILPRIEIPVLILQAEQEQIVNNKNLLKLNRTLPQGQHCEIPQAKHEILFERDEIRDFALGKIFTFFEDK